MISTLPPPPQKYKFGSEAEKKIRHFSLTEKKKRRKEGVKEGKKRGGKEKRKEGKKVGRKERKEAKKECKCVFRLKKQLVLYPSSPIGSTNLDQRPGKI